MVGDRWCSFTERLFKFSGKIGAAFLSATFPGPMLAISIKTRYSVNHLNSSYIEISKKSVYCGNPSLVVISMVPYTIFIGVFLKKINSNFLV